MEKNLKSVYQQSFRISEFSKVTGYKDNMQKLIVSCVLATKKYEIKFKRYIQNSFKICKIPKNKYNKNLGKTSTLKNIKQC